ncbi:DNA-directed RNA polymerase subunit beta [Candidatus Karelsulcia muelleri]
MKDINKIISFEKIKQKISYPDFLNLQIESFKKFISYDYKNQNHHKNDGLTKVFNEFFPIKKYKKFNIWFKGYYLSKPLHSPEYCLERGLTYSVKLIGKFHLIFKVKRNNSKKYKKNYKISLRTNEKQKILSNNLTTISKKIDSTIPNIYSLQKNYKKYFLSKIYKKSKTKSKLKSLKIKRINENIFLCNLPYMTPNGSFIFNGYERVIVAQIIKASGLFFGELSIQNGYKYYYGKIIPEKGILLEFTADNSNLLNVILDGKNKFYLTTFLRAIGYSHDDDILNLFKLSKTIVLNKKNERYLMGKILAGKVLTFWFEDFVDEISGEVVTVERSSIILDRNIRINKKIINKLKTNKIKKVLIKQKEDYTSEYAIIYNTLKRDQTNSQEEALIYILQNIKKKDQEHKEKNNKKKTKINISFYDLLISIKKISISQRCRMKLNKILKYPKKILSITYEDILAVIDNLIALYNSKKEIEELEHLSNKAVNTIDGQLKAQFSLGLSKILADFKEQIKKIRKKRQKINTIMKYCNPKKLIKAKYFNNILNTYFATNPLSQFMDQMNPLSELTHKRRLSYLGTGGLSRERAGYEIRDINYSYYGRLCPIETPEGPNIGLISSLCVFAEVNSMGNLITPYLRVKKGNITNNLIYLSSEDEIGKAICQLYKKNFFYSSKQKICRINSDYQMIANDKIDLMDVAYNQMASISVSLIPFLEHDDANRALMGSNMMRQAVPLLKPDLPIVYTGMEKDMIKYTRNIIYSKRKGIVKYVNSNKIIIENNNKLFRKNITIHRLPKFKNTNQNTCITLNPIVKIGDKIKKGQVLSEGFATKQGELALGKNIRVAFMPFKGYNFEDAIVVSEKIIKQDYFTSIKIMKLTIEARKTKLSKEKFTNKIPNISKKEKKTLDKKGIVKIGTFINPGKIIVGKISKVSESEIRPEKKLLRAILGEKKLNIKDRSVRAGPSIKGIVIRRSIFRPAKKNKIFLKQAEDFKQKKIYIRNLLYKKYNLLKRSINKNNKINQTIKKKMLDTILKDLTQEKRRLYNIYSYIKEIKRNRDQLPPGIDKIIKLYIAEKRNLKVGDKMSGRHGNKGVVAKIVKEEDMPFLEDGTIIDMVLNPLGVPSRMNLGQIYETITGEIGYKLKRRLKTPIFNGGTMKDLLNYGKQAKIANLGKTYLYNGETGEKFKYPTTVGILYMLKLGHMVDDKMHARSIGPYSLITQQPLGGKSQYGGQRFGEMEVWALEAFGASNILQELLTIKSDDIKGRIKTYESIVKGLKLPKPSTPESLRVLKNELKGLCIKLKLSK